VIRGPSDVPVRNIARTARRIQRAAQWSLRVYRLGLSKNRFTRGCREHPCGIQTCVDAGRTGLDRQYRRNSSIDECVDRAAHAHRLPCLGRNGQLESVPGLQRHGVSVGRIASSGKHRPLTFWCQILAGLRNPGLCVGDGLKCGRRLADASASLRANHQVVEAPRRHGPVADAEPQLAGP